MRADIVQHICNAAELVDEAAHEIIEAAYDLQNLGRFHDEFHPDIDELANQLAKDLYAMRARIEQAIKPVANLIPELDESKRDLLE